MIAISRGGATSSSTTWSRLPKPPAPSAIFAETWATTSPASASHSGLPR